MYCIVLRGVLGVLALAAIIAVVLGALYCLIVGLDKCQNISFRIHPTVRKIGNYVLNGIAIIGISMAVSIGCWSLGGDLLKRFFHFCVG